MESKSCAFTGIGSDGPYAQSFGAWDEAFNEGEYGVEYGGEYEDYCYGEDSLSNPYVQPGYNTTSKKVHYYSIGTYNILRPQTEGMHTDRSSSDMGYYQDLSSGKILPNSGARIAIVIDNIIKANLNFICLQDVTRQAYETMSKKLKSAGYQGFFAEHDNMLGKQNTWNSCEGVAIFFTELQFTFLKESKGQFTYQLKSQKYPVKRTHLALDLKDKWSRIIFRIATCHCLDPRFFEADKALQVRQILKDNSMSVLDKLSYKIDYVVIAGDMSQSQFGDSDLPHSGECLSPDISRATSLLPFFYDEFVCDSDPFSSKYRRKNPDDFNSFPVSTGHKVDYIMIKKLTKENVTYQYPLPIENFDPSGSNHRLVKSVLVVEKQDSQQVVPGSMYSY